ncbi:MAG TPA: Hsp20/alpha crystallin family protein [Acidimicrobiia bacterium]|nr:Hsp20/alpha crystallin family protein [Acidimicrobiia bacterium]
MELKVWSPFFDLDKEWHLFDFPRVAREITGFAIRPSIDLVKKDGELIVTVELPGIDPENVEVSLDDDILTITGEKTDEREISEDDRYMHERSFGKFQRRIPLPDGVSADKVTADYDKGVLTVSVPLPEDTTPEPRHIPVEVKATS